MASEGNADSDWEGYRRGSVSYRRLEIAMLLAGIASFAQLYAPQGMLPQIAQSFNVSEASSALMVSTGTAGLSIAVVPWSLVADRIGRKNTISIAVLAATVLGLVSTAVPSFEWTLVVRFLEGVALGGVPAVAMAFINEEIHRRDAAGAVGTFVAGNTFGGLLGRIIAGPVGDATGSWKTGFLTVAGLSVVASLLFMVLSPRPVGFTSMGGTGNSVARSVLVTIQNAWTHLKSPVLLVLYLEPFLLMGGFVAIYNYLGYHLSGDPFFLPVWLSSLVFLAYIAGSVASPVAGRLAERFGRKPVMLMFLLVAMAGLAILLIPNAVVITAGLVVFTGAFFGTHAVCSGWAGAYPTFGRAQSTALYNLGYYIGSSVFGFAGGLFYQHWGWLALVAMVAALFVVALGCAVVVLPGKPPAATQ